MTFTPWQEALSIDAKPYILNDLDYAFRWKVLIMRSYLNEKTSRNWMRVKTLDWQLRIWADTYIEAAISHDIYHGLMCVGAGQAAWIKCLEKKVYLSLDMRSAENGGLSKMPCGIKLLVRSTASIKRRGSRCSKNGTQRVDILLLPCVRRARLPDARASSFACTEILLFVVAVAALAINLKREI